MTASAPVLRGWATRPLGKATRVALAAGGMVLATMILTYAAVATSGTWILVLLGFGMAATSVRAAHIPSVGRLVSLAAVALAVPLSIQIF